MFNKHLLAKAPVSIKINPKQIKKSLKFTF